jgi:hypothetical protein
VVFAAVICTMHLAPSSFSLKKGNKKNNHPQQQEQDPNDGPDSNTPHRERHPFPSQDDVASPMVIARLAARRRFSDPTP